MGEDDPTNPPASAGKNPTKAPADGDLAPIITQLGTTVEALNAFLETAGKERLSASGSGSLPSPAPAGSPRATSVAGPADPTPHQSRIRGETAAVDVSKMKDPEIVALGAKSARAMFEQVKQDKRQIICKDMDALAAAMAEDENSDPKAAKKRLIENEARAFTAEKTGVIYFLECDEKPHDEIHETVHLISAPGGATIIHSQFSELLNEGFTEFFTIKYCNELKIEVAPAYPDEVAFVTKLGKAVGLPMLHAAYLQNRGMDAIISNLADRWGKGRAKWLQAHSTKSFPVPEESGGRVKELTERFKDKSYKENPKWWNAIFALPR